MKWSVSLRTFSRNREKNLRYRSNVCRVSVFRGSFMLVAA